MDASPDLLDILAGHDHHTGCDFQDGFLTGLNRAATYLQDYGHHLPPAELRRLQGPILRAVAVAACDGCNHHGTVVDDRDRHIEHHPLTTEGGPV